MTIGIIIGCLIFYLLHKWNCNRIYKQAYKKGVNDAASKMSEFSYWMSDKPEIHNTLYLVSHHISKSGFLISNKLKQDLETIGDVRFGDLEPELKKQFLE